MELFGKIIFGLGIFFAGFAVLIGSATALWNLAFMAIAYLLRDQLKSIFCRLTTNKFLLLVIFGTMLGLSEELLWYVGHEIESKPQQWLSLSDDIIRMGPVYLLLYAFLHQIIRKYPFTGKQAFMYGGISGYIFYFIMEGSGMGFSPIWLITLWEINNFLLNGFLFWMPLYVSENLEQEQERTVPGHMLVLMLAFFAVLAAITATLLLLGAIGYTPA